MRDYDGLVQCVFDSYQGPINVHYLRDESVVRITGSVRMRPEGTENPKLKTGEVEITVTELEILNEADILPFKVMLDEGEDDNSNLEQRLTYRYLDLRRKENQKMLRLRSDVLFEMRCLMHDEGFTEIQTPILTASSPEGARDYLVPARLHPGKFYALPQAPQMFKQLLMASGVEKYFQIAPCFRDEAGRSDRAPGEFYQLDLEMAFAKQDDVFGVVERVIGEIFMEYGHRDFTINQSHFYDSTMVTESPTGSDWRQFSYKEAMLRFGTDKPDLRAELEIMDLTDFFAVEGPQFIVDAVNKGQVVKGIYIAHATSFTGKFYKDAESYARTLGMPGLGYIKTGFAVHSGKTSAGPLAKMMSSSQIGTLENLTGSNTLSSSEAQAVFIIVGEDKDATAWAADLRVELSKRAGRYTENTYEFCWIVDYPMFELDERGKIEFSHNPFSMPKGGMTSLNGDPLKVLAQQYDLVCNGVEISSGAIRNHDPAIMLKAFSIAGYSQTDVESKFPSLWKAFHYGCPPHGGIAPGFDRIMMLLMGKENIRDVIAFPMNGQAEDLMMGAPNEPTDEQLKELNIRVVKPLKGQ